MRIFSSYFRQTADKTVVVGDSLGTLVTLLLVVVERFTSIVRDETTNPRDVVGSQPLLTPLSLLSRGNTGDGNDGEEDDENGGNENDGSLWRLPRLGRLNVVHTTNVLMLGAAFMLLASPESSGSPAVRNVLSFVVAVVWVQLPVLEVKGYDAIRNAGIVPVSLYWHAVGTGLLVAGALFLPDFEPGRLLTSQTILTEGPNSVENFGGQVVGLLSLTVPGAVMVGGYLKLLECELLGAAGADDGDSDDSDDGDDSDGEDSDTDLPDPWLSYAKP